MPPDYKVLVVARSYILQSISVRMRLGAIVYIFATRLGDQGLTRLKFSESDPYVFLAYYRK